MKNLNQPNLKLLLFCIGISFLIACGSQKDTAMSRGMQNLTARYNYIYNSNVILDNYEEDLYQEYTDNYSEILPVYTAPEKFNTSQITTTTPVNDKALNAIIAKAQVIIADKSFSNYIDDSYLLLGKAYYFKGDYFIAEEYFDYAAKTYETNIDVVMSALNWKARSLMQLNNLKDAALILDTVYTNLSMIKTRGAEPRATIAQMYIYQDRIDEAIPLLESAVKLSHLKRNRIRWTYILAQLYEKQKNYQEALRNYVKVQKSNAAFELYFNANLNKIKLTGLLNGEKLDRKKQLLILLRDDKNFDYTDQIYYQVAESYAEDGNFAEAEKYYQLSARKSTKNKYQKGISYLRIADLNFKNTRDFLKAKLYYDSTVNTLPKNYPGYEQIVKKSQNLEYLTERYDAVALQDTLQMLAKLPEQERAARAEQLITPVIAKTIATTTINQNNLFLESRNRENSAGTSSGTFYFSNAMAVSRGYTDFLTRWGNRKPEDNWRQSIKSSSQTTAESIAKVEDNGNKTGKGPDSVAGNNSNTALAKYLKDIPVTPELLKASDQKIIDSYYEIANFYQQQLDDQQEAARIYQLILSRFPENNRLPAIYYSLHLGYKDNDPANSTKYKNLVLSQFPNSVYAKTIKDPNFSAKQSEIEAVVIQKYNKVFNKYERKSFREVIREADTIKQQYPDNILNPQLAYLKAISIGRTQHVDSLVTAFKNISTTYPDDKVIVPLVNDHLAYLSSHMGDYSKRKIALPDFDPNEPRLFTSDPLPNIPEPVQTAEKLPVEIVETPVEVKETATPATVITPSPVKVAADIFSKAVSDTYYFVIDVADASLTLSSSRFGIGQFNRGNYAENGLKHRLTEFDNDQLIYVGNFSSFAEAKSYANGITPQLKQIMKVPEDIYTTFIISKENFEKLQNKELVTNYLEFYKNNY
ncbi:tetratricopeptide repeat protein [Pedobacter sp. MR2016-24]|uniref:type IX secretion system periplasmic lipoprotein PorW/SprE n=1 Tax=Pedobacter sp. MR2016-24 TaxID=2994466 RepID=UPI002246D6EF|nr:tetratricopeptide repeat protein [Pedobacter sp. MR2016-24]MCX2482302.1 tetratricopeptide repeat protein [Pedobacter sp. MR2016-24]